MPCYTTELAKTALTGESLQVIQANLTGSNSTQAGKPDSNTVSRDCMGIAKAFEQHILLKIVTQ